MSIEKIYHMKGLPDSQGDDATSIDYASIADDAELKLISIMDAIGIISSDITVEASKKKINPEKIESLGGTVAELSELALFLNKISMDSHYLSGLKDGSGVTAK